MNLILVLTGKPSSARPLRRSMVTLKIREDSAILGNRDHLDWAVLLSPSVRAVVVYCYFRARRHSCRFFMGVIRPCSYHLDDRALLAGCLVAFLAMYVSGASGLVVTIGERPPERA
jgi:hypothetical protein